MRLQLVVLIGLSFVLGSTRAKSEESVPEWFRFDAERPYAIFDAWKELSTRKAMVCLGENWQVLAGRLRNKRGEPLGNTPLKFDFGRGKARSAELQTDSNGFFIIYSPWELELGREIGISGLAFGPFISATPGFPSSQAGQYFAYKRQAIKVCETKVLMRLGERAFYDLTCNDDARFEPEEFRTFESDYLTQQPNPRPPYRAQPRDPEGKPEGPVLYHDLQVVNEAGVGVADTIVKYRLAGMAPGFQVRRTDEAGRCRIEEWHRTHGDRILRGLTIDAPGFGVGPVPFGPKPNANNIIRLLLPATVVGRIADDEGKPTGTRLRLQYKSFSWIDFETEFATRADGTFQFDRVMPNEEFRVQSGNTRSAWMSLKENEISKEVLLRRELPAALRGVVVSEKGELVPANLFGGPGSGLNLSLDFGPGESFLFGNSRVPYFGTNNGPWGPSDGRFGFSDLSNRPFRIRVSGWEVEPAEEIQLEPGEMRFVRVVLTKRLPRPN